MHPPRMGDVLEACVFSNHTAVIREWFEHPRSLDEAEEQMLAKLEARAHELLTYIRKDLSVTEARFGEEVELLDGSKFATLLIVRRGVGGIRLTFTLLRNGESAIYANPPGDYLGGYHYIIGEYAKLFEGDIRDINWEAGCFTIVIDA